MVYDDQTKEWRPQWGYKKANEDHTAIMEAAPGDDGSVDPFEAKRNEKKERIQKQKVKLRVCVCCVLCECMKQF